MVKRPSVDRTLFITTLVLVVGGLFIFLSASLGLLARNGAQFSDIAIGQLVLGFGGGLVALVVLSNIPYRIWRKYALYIFILALFGMALVFVPGLGVELKGARRWVDLGIITFQPSEFLKIAYIIYLATWLSGVKAKVADMRHGLIPFAIVSAITGLALLVQPDTDTFLVIAVAGIAMFWASGARMRDIAIIVGVGLIGLVILVSMRPYLADRLTTFLDPSADSQGKGYQIQQSLLAIGSGEIFGRGFGQSIQKFNKLPEPISDSIFSVYAEEFGFVGSVMLILAFLTFAMRGLWVAARSPDMFGGLLTVGIVILIVFQSFLNIGAMLGILPLTGLPLVFISHGGTALMSALASVGIVLSVSRSVHT